jgi:hypothetical protein
MNTGQNQMQAQAAADAAYEAVIDSPCLLCGKYRDESNDLGFPIAIGRYPGPYRGCVCQRCFQNARTLVNQL